MASSKEPTDHAGTPVAAPSTTLDRLPPWDGAPFRGGVTVSFGLNMSIHALSARWFDHSAPGSGLAVILLMASLIAGMGWKTAAEQPPPFVIFICALAAVPPVAAYLYAVFVLGEDDE